MATLSPPAEADVHSPDAASLRVPAAVPVPALVTDADACPSCGAGIAGDYCGACGERRPKPEHFTVRHFFREISDTLFGLDSRAVRSFRLLLTRPGFLTLEALRGRRKPYLGPLKMYLGVFALITLLSPVFTSQSDKRAQQADALTAQLDRAFQYIAAQNGMNVDVVRRTLTTTMLQHQGWMALLVPLLFAVVIHAVFRRRRPRFGEQLLFALHFATFNYTVGLIILIPQLPGIGAGVVVMGIISLATLAVQFAYMAVAIRRVYGGSRRAAVGWTVVLTMGFGVAQMMIGIMSLGTAVARLMYF